MVEVKKTVSVNARDFNGIRAFAGLNEKHFSGGAVLYPGQEVVPFGNKLRAVPFYVLWQ
ncbi:MAG: hypothetical protein KIT80_21460 [Chitinophagaceae bacterium]|nr:hypothetical protein [Chitinophagaceae bacterium]MCW5929503.1 hypothetical protein [Chitinophagaceae bacterium]